MRLASMYIPVGNIDACYVSETSAEDELTIFDKRYDGTEDSQCVAVKMINLINTYSQT
jgi:hypothetical protein